MHVELERFMKKNYVKPVLVRRDTLERVTAEVPSGVPPR